MSEGQRNRLRRDSNLYFTPYKSATVYHNPSLSLLCYPFRPLLPFVPSLLPFPSSATHSLLCFPLSLLCYSSYPSPGHILSRIYNCTNCDQLHTKIYPVHHLPNLPNRFSLRFPTLLNTSLFYLFSVTHSSSLPLVIHSSSLVHLRYSSTPFPLPHSPFTALQASNHFNCSTHTRQPMSQPPRSPTPSLTPHVDRLTSETSITRC